MVALYLALCHTRTRTERRDSSHSTRHLISMYLSPRIHKEIHLHWEIRTLFFKERTLTCMYLWHQVARTMPAPPHTSVGYRHSILDFEMDWDVSPVVLFATVKFDDSLGSTRSGTDISRSYLLRASFTFRRRGKALVSDHRTWKKVTCPTARKSLCFAVASCKFISVPHYINIEVSNSTCQDLYSAKLKLVSS
jgi:hypothetical protein